MHDMLPSPPKLLSTVCTVAAAAIQRVWLEKCLAGSMLYSQFVGAGIPEHGQQVTSTHICYELEPSAYLHSHSTILDVIQRN
jgi:hypothetical protein